MSDVYSKQENTIEVPAGTLKLTTAGGLPVFIHWTFPLGGLLIAVTAPRSNLYEYFYYPVAFCCLLTVHEFGHMVAAKLLNLKVYSIVMHSIGGESVIDPPLKIGNTLLMFSAGLLVQCALMLITILYIENFGVPRGSLGRCFVEIFTFYNALLFLINIIPFRTHLYSTDGGILWQLLEHFPNR